MNPLIRQGQLLVCAAQFLTRLPTPRLGAFEPDWIARSARYFPLVGQLVGLLSAAVWLAAGRFWPGLPAAVLAVAAGVLATGGFHEDGLADTADGLGDGQDRERRLAIMKDSRIGGYGALALGLMLTLRIGLLAGLSPWSGALALVVAHGGARAAAVMVMAALPYAGDPDGRQGQAGPSGRTPVRGGHRPGDRRLAAAAARRAQGPPGGLLGEPGLALDGAGVAPADRRGDRRCAGRGWSSWRRPPC